MQKIKNSSKSDDLALNGMMFPDSGDVEVAKEPKEYLEGFTDFSHYMASDDALFIFRRFGSLSARNILYLQAELQLLEQQLQELDELDNNVLRQLGEGNEKALVDSAARSWESFKDQADRVERQKTKMDLIVRLRTLMKEYG